MQFRGVTAISPILLTTTSTTLVIDLATTGVTAGTYGNSTSVPSITVNVYGQITSATNVPITQSFATASIPYIVTALVHTVYYSIINILIIILYDNFI